MKKLFALVFVGVLIFALASCETKTTVELTSYKTQYSLAITKIVELDATNQVLQKNIPTVTNTPPPKPTPKPTIKPTITPTSGPNYILENGFCIMGIPDSEINGNPADTAGCGVQERKQIHLGQYENITMTFTRENANIQIYCALFDLSGKFIMYDMDTLGEGKAVCNP